MIITLTHLPSWRKTKFCVEYGVVPLDDLRSLFAGRPEIKCRISLARSYADITYTNVTGNDHNTIVSYLILYGLTIKSKVVGDTIDSNLGH